MSDRFSRDPVLHFVSRDRTEFRALSTGLQQVLVLPAVLSTELEVHEGDQILVRELASDQDRYASAFSPFWLCRRVTHRMSSLDCPGGISRGWAIFSLNTPSENEWKTAFLRRKLAEGLRRGLSEDAFWRELEASEQRRALELQKMGQRLDSAQSGTERASV